MSFYDSDAWSVPLQLRTISSLLTVKVCRGPFHSVSMLFTVKVCGPFFRKDSVFLHKYPVWLSVFCVFPLVKDDLQYSGCQTRNNSIFFVCGTEILFFCTISCLIAGQLSQFILYAKQLITVNRKKSVETVWLQFCSQRSAIKVLVQQPFVVEALKYVSHCCITDSSPFRVKSKKYKNNLLLTFFVRRL